MLLWDRLQTALLQRVGVAVVQVESGGRSALTIRADALLEIADRLAGLVQSAWDSDLSGGEPAVGLFLSNSAAYVAAVLAAVQLGLPFLPLDPRWPAARLQAIALDAQPVAVVWAPRSLPGGHGPPEIRCCCLLELPTELLEPLQPPGPPGPTSPHHPAPAPAAAARAPTGTAPGGQCPAAEQGTRLAACSGRSSPGGSDPGRGRSGSSCAYLLYTSGSTGRPLGARGTQAGLLNRCDWMLRAFPLRTLGAASPSACGRSSGRPAAPADTSTHPTTTSSSSGGDCVAFKTAPCFVDSLWEVFGPLLAGVPLVAVPLDVSTNPAELLRVVAEHQVTYLAAVPTLWAALLASAAAPPQLQATAAAAAPPSPPSPPPTPAAAAAGQAMPVPQLSSVRLAVSSGEPLPLALLRRMQGALPAGCTMLNLYGSTEVAADATFFNCSRFACVDAEPGQQQQQQRQQRQQHAEHGAAEQEAASVPVGYPISNTITAILPGEPDSPLRGKGGQEKQRVEAEQEQQQRGKGEQLQQGGLSQQQAELHQHQQVVLVEPTSTPSPGALPTWWQPVPVGAVGDVVVGGAGVAAGYLHAPPSASGRFVGLSSSSSSPAQLLSLLREAAASGLSVAVGEMVEGGRSVEQQQPPQPPPQQQHKGEWVQRRSGLRLFRTGDRGWMDPGGCLHLSGRADLQVKVAGVRVDLAEVEAVLSQHPAVHSAAARLWHLPGGPLLASYAELLPGHELSTGSSGSVEAELQAWCRQRLPPAGVPGRVVLLHQLPRSAAGKVQRGALPPVEAARIEPAEQKQQQVEMQVEPQGAGENQAGPVVPARKRLRTAATPPAQPQQRPQPPAGPAPAQRVSEVTVGQAFAAALGHASFEPTQSLFALGGTSLTATQMAGWLGVPPESVFEHPSVRSLTAYLNGGGGQRGRQQLQPQQAGQLSVGMGASRPGLLDGAPRLALPASMVRDEAVLVQQPEGKVQQQQEQHQRHQQHSQASLVLAWRSKLLACVDVSPLIPVPPPPAAGTAVAPASASVSGGVRKRAVFACSHGGDVVCLDPWSGESVWQQELPGRADAGMVLCTSSPCLEQHQQPAQQQPAPELALLLAVATNDRGLFFLDPGCGGVVGTLDCGAAVRAAPVVDPWAGLVWLATHAASLLVIAPPRSSLPGRGSDSNADPGEAPSRGAAVVAQAACPTAVSAEVAFDQGRRLAFVACLDGSLLAFKVEVQPQAFGAQAGAHHSIDRDGGSSGIVRLQLAKAWLHRCPAPLFCPPAPVPAAGVVTAAAVDGTIEGLAASSGQLLWRMAAGSAIYAPLLVLQPQGGGGGGGRKGPLPWWLVVGTQGGRLLVLDPVQGGQLAACSLGQQVTGLGAIPAAAACQQEVTVEVGGTMVKSSCSSSRVAVTTGAGSVALIDLQPGGQSVSKLHDILAAPVPSLVAAVQLPGEVFAPPVIVCGGGGLGGLPPWPRCLVGCRDDHVYCLEVSL